MEKIGNVPWEMVVVVLTFIGLAVIPPIVGYGLLRVYRRYRPVDVSHINESPLARTKARDGFLKILLCGWIICGPVFYVLYVLLSGLLPEHY